MRPVSYAALFLGVLSTALGQTLAPSPTESVGCEPHGDHWHCQGPRVTSAPADAAATTGAAVATSSASHDEDHHDHTEDHDHHTDSAGTASLKPSPTESYGCEPHGDHWHCEGPRTASSSAASTLVTAITSTPPGATTPPASSTSSVSTAAAARYDVAGLGFAGLAAVAAMAL
ncbi:hypothetical protein VTI74DRAFT_5402 [Chaetomium olivicolor]